VASLKVARCCPEKESSHQAAKGWTMAEVTLRVRSLAVCRAEMSGYCCETHSAAPVLLRISLPSADANPAFGIFSASRH